MASAARVSHGSLTQEQAQLIHGHVWFPSSTPQRSLSNPLFSEAFRSHCLRRKVLQDEDAQGTVLVRLLVLFDPSDGKISFFNGLEGFREAIPCDGKRENCEETGWEAALVGEEEHQEETPAFQNGISLYNHQ